MPRRLVSRVYAVVFVAVVVTLVGLLVPALLHYRESGEEAEQPATTAPRAAFENVTVPIRTTAPARPATTTVVRRTPVQRPAATAEPKLVLVAARGPCWVSVRAGSVDADVLYEGTLAQGRRLTFERERVFLRVGSGENLTVVVDGKRLLGLPDSTGDVVVANGHIRPA